MDGYLRVAMVGERCVIREGILERVLEMTEERMQA
jgi:hypothetical protein